MPSLKLSSLTSSPSSSCRCLLRFKTPDVETQYSGPEGDIIDKWDKKNKVGGNATEMGWQSFGRGGIYKAMVSGKTKVQEKWMIWGIREKGWSERVLISAV
ncbi:hypothetical protein B0H11DRAFT_1899311 [Mycena galericulata]|nr:hypothetical protein B0H11DRAFT_1899311 [Mycena galericulata]